MPWILGKPYVLVSWMIRRESSADETAESRSPRRARQSAVKYRMYLYKGLHVLRMLSIVHGTDELLCSSQ
jgi:hypothetical protein